jgi:hypothetical protein
MKYNHSDKNHRLFLAGRVLDMLSTAGFEEVEMPMTEERVFARNVVVKNDKGEPVTTPVRVLVYTSIDKRSKEIRKVGTDAIRICGVRSYKDGTEKGCIKRKRVNRVGEIDDVVGRALERMRTAYKEALLAYRSPTHCKSCGAMNFVSKTGNDVCSDLCFTKKAGYKPKPKKTFKKYRRTYKRGRR